ncbi:nitrate/nitrite transport system substrate-binding protein [Halopseudomonas xinjiangensis]|uniref:Nitrate/nitrite transport system substrate-binding protein n=1 Tax=Halopseudomonas xinjiangensis TaxID=487184 RepID=A0A1H1P285_9GAMM|nr:CmpA/NrtA family ABC transporter substrate-binding protein [Halopseudomonas xinjiangensis]SDS04719.1 nitrate/nitrite transport system substrate-binding protein [Halopseudomonas xinjiangensis]
MNQYDTPRADALAWADGSDAPEKPNLNIGYLPLTDSASLIVAATQGFAQPYGLTLNLRRQASWSGVRDRLRSGELDAVQGLYGLIYGMHLGLGAPATPMAVLMGLNQNGQSINLSNGMRDLGVTDGKALARHVHQSGAKLCLAQTFPTGTHAMWLNYWLAAHGIHPQRDVNTQVVPPSMMVEHLRARRIDGFCAGEPWGACAIEEGMGITVATSQSIWPDHPEKVLGTTRAFVERYPNTARALVMAVLDASRFIDESEANRESTAQLIASSEFVSAKPSTLTPRMLGEYDDGAGRIWQDGHPLRFHGAGTVNVPYLSDGIWFMTQFRRWGLLDSDPDYLGIAGEVQQLELYRQAAGALGIEVPASPMRSSILGDGTLWDGSDPVGYAHGFALHALAGTPSAPSTIAE